ncbi:MAG TPA: hypothetical protein PLH98_15105 [Ruminococcus flavefaciens]|nr:hypothetical protein [Ruminococcus flavefaciens]
MKNYDEMYQSVLSKYDEYLEKKKKRIRMIRRTVPVLACLCLTIGLGIGYRDHFIDLMHPPKQPEIVDDITTVTPDTTTNNTTIRTENTAEPVTTTLPVHSSVSDRNTSTQTAHTQAVTTPETETSMKTEQVTEKPTETPVPVTTAAAVQTAASTEPTTALPIQTTEDVTVTTADHGKETPVITTDPNIRELSFGYRKEGGNDMMSPSSSKKILLKCLSFCANGETLMVDAAMADVRLRPDRYDSSGDFAYEVYVCNPINFKDIGDEKFIVNGEHKGYKKEFSKEDVPLFDINGEEKNYDRYHHETTEIDFSDYEVGDSGCIKFFFMEVYSDDPLHPSYMGAIQFMYFYVGEKGTSISNLSVEDAMESYQLVTAQ